MNIKISQEMKQEFLKELTKTTRKNQMEYDPNYKCFIFKEGGLDVLFYEKVLEIYGLDEEKDEELIIEEDLFNIISNDFEEIANDFFEKKEEEKNEKVEKLSNLLDAIETIETDELEDAYKEVQRVRGNVKSQII